MHAVPHAPQFARSEAMSTQSDPQRISPPGHTIVHVPPTQLSPVMQVVPHVPQFIGSVCVSAQYGRPPAGMQTSSVPQLVSQWPMLQTIPDAHALPQLPQSSRFTRGSTQLVPHASSPAGQLSVHAPRTHA